LTDLSRQTTTPGAPHNTRLAGKLEEVTLAGLLQMLAAKHKSGKLMLRSREAHGVVLLHEGTITYAASNSAREALGNILIRRGLVDGEVLIRALEKQHLAEEEKRLGAILVEMGAMSEDALESVVREQTTGIIQELLSWGEGYFDFEPLVVPGAEIGVDAGDLVMDRGLDAEQVVKGTSRAREITPSVKASAVLSGGTPAQVAAGVHGVTVTSLKEVMAELRAPTFGGEITTWLLRHASAIVRRCVLFSYSRDSIRAMGQIGIAPDGASDEELSMVRIPAAEPSIFTQVAESRESYVGELARTTWNEYVAIELGGLIPPQVVVVPMVVNGNVVALLYGDNLPTADPIGPIDALELLMLQAGLAMEKTTLEIRLRTLQERLGTA
jgi:Domain of unknown function (DUF4388)